MGRRIKFRAFLNHYTDPARFGRLPFVGKSVTLANQSLLEPMRKRSRCQAFEKPVEETIDGVSCSFAVVRI